MKDSYKKEFYHNYACLVVYQIIFHLGNNVCFADLDFGITSVGTLCWIAGIKAVASISSAVSTFISHMIGRQE